MCDSDRSVSQFDDEFVSDEGLDYLVSGIAASVHNLAAGRTGPISEKIINVWRDSIRATEASRLLLSRCPDPLKSDAFKLSISIRHWLRRGLCFFLNVDQVNSDEAIQDYHLKDEITDWNVIQRWFEKGRRLARQSSHLVAVIESLPSNGSAKIEDELSATKVLLDFRFYLNFSQKRVTQLVEAFLSRLAADMPGNVEDASERSQSVPDDIVEYVLSFVREREVASQTNVCDAVVDVLGELTSSLNDLNYVAIGSGFSAGVATLSWKLSAEANEWRKSNPTRYAVVQLARAIAPPWHYRLVNSEQVRLQASIADEVLTENVKAISTLLLDHFEQWIAGVEKMLRRELAAHGWSDQSLPPRESFVNTQLPPILPPGDWLIPPVSLQDLSRRLNVSVHKVKVILDPHDLQRYPPENPQSWTVNLERMSPSLRRSVEKLLDHKK